MKWNYFVFCFTIFSYADQQVRAASTRGNTCSLNLVGTSVDQVGRAISPILNEIRTEIRELREKTISQNEQILTQLTSIKELAELAKEAEDNPCERPFVYGLVMRLPRSGIPDRTKEYYLFGAITNYESIQAHCEAFGLRIATVENEATYNYLSPLLTNYMNNLDPDRTKQGFFLAGTDKDTPGRWYWKPKKTSFTFSPWYQGEPSGDDEHCVVLQQVDGTSSFSFTSTRCTESRRALCEHKCFF